MTFEILYEHLRSFKYKINIFNLHLYTSKDFLYKRRFN